MNTASSRLRRFVRFPTILAMVHLQSGHTSHRSWNLSPKNFRRLSVYTFCRTGRLLNTATDGICTFSHSYLRLGLLLLEHGTTPKAATERERRAAADGIGGSLKRFADRLVAHGKDIPDPQTLYDVLDGQTVTKLFYITANDIQSTESLLSNVSVKRVPATMRLHQVVVHQIGHIETRHLSCFSCPPGVSCSHYLLNDDICTSQSILSLAAIVVHLCLSLFFYVNDNFEVTCCCNEISLMTGLDEQTEHAVPVPQNVGSHRHSGDLPRKERRQKQSTTAARVSHRQKRRRQKKTTDVRSLDTVPCTACGIQFCADTSGLKWIQCQICNNWFHLSCQGLEENYDEDEFVCIDCEWHEQHWNWSVCYTQVQELVQLVKYFSGFYATAFMYCRLAFSHRPQHGAVFCHILVCYNS